MGPKNRTVDELIGRIASRQHGVVTRAQLLDAGVSDKEIRRRLERKALLRVHRGVYRVGHRAPSVEARYHAAVLACGEGAVLSGKAAGYLWGLVKGTAPPPEVTTKTERRIKGIRTRRARSNEQTEATTRHGIPTTTVPRTLVDLSSLLPLADLARACHEAGVLHQTTPLHVEEVLEKRPNTPGAKKLRKVVHGDVHVTLSALERRFLRRLREEALPLPETNKPAGGRRVDCRWPQHNLTVELDSYRYHRSRHAWELDRRREREAHARGDDFRRYTHDDVFQSPGHMLRELGALLRVAKG
ncbi:MAG TPA: type IV toxin-antitoxin system AbiEi family antitoxin domain-containing protein [Thermoleophilaceae bacterium]|nr:type IV toxin-antitoxin system AbiEi family antitoxin domain-containing protein [Thermoleophilaceae bacterium]